ncbi:hypothetical protein AB0D54_03210 [Streptomyces xanthophaeus]|uniref:hypothetical protein n=1 Tax=Streptomyces xanthophaeus TaxID=67385 RepID=UPI0034350E6E
MRMFTFREVVVSGAAQVRAEHLPASEPTCIRTCANSAYHPNGARFACPSGVRIGTDWIDRGPAGVDVDKRGEEFAVAMRQQLAALQTFMDRAAGEAP